MDPYRIRLGLVSKEIEIIPDDDSLDVSYVAQLEPSGNGSVTWISSSLSLSHGDG